MIFTFHKDKKISFIGINLYPNVSYKLLSIVCDTILKLTKLQYIGTYKQILLLKFWPSGQHGFRFPAYQISFAIGILILKAYKFYSGYDHTFVSLDGLVMSSGWIVNSYSLEYEFFFFWFSLKVLSYSLVERNEKLWFEWIIIREGHSRHTWIRTFSRDF